MIKIIDFSSDKYFNEEDRLTLEYTALKKAKKIKLDYFNNLEYSHEHGYFNLTLDYKNTSLSFQLLLAEKEIYYKWDDNFRNLPNVVRTLIGYLSNQNDHANRFYSLVAAQQYLMMIQDMLRSYDL